MSAFWHMTEAFSLSLEGIYLTDGAERLYTTGDGTMNLICEINFRAVATGWAGSEGRSGPGA